MLRETTEVLKQNREVRNSPHSCLWSEECSCHCLRFPSPEPQLSVVLACCCFQATFSCYSRSILRAFLSSNLCPCVGSAVPSTDRRGSVPRLLLFVGSIRIINSKGMGSGHRRNRMTAPKMVGCEVVMETRGKLLNSVRCFLLFLPLPPHRQDEELRCVSGKQGGKGEKTHWCAMRA